MPNTLQYREESRSSRYGLRTSQKLSEILAPCLSLILQLRESDNFGDSDALRSRILALLKQGEQRALSAEIQAPDISDARFALIAFIDEVIRSSNWEEKSSWITNPLQFELYGHMVAGEEFFERLGRLKSDAIYRRNALEVYYLCLSLGFKGKYQMEGTGGQHKLRVLIDEVYARISSVSDVQVDHLSPNGIPQDQKKAERQKKVSPVLILIASIVIGLAVYFVFTFLINGSVNTLCDELTSISQLGAICR